MSKEINKNVEEEDQTPAQRSHLFDLSSSIEND
jgi:hypothetical protein